MATIPPPTRKLRVRRLFVAPASTTPSAPLLSLQESPRSDAGQPIEEEDKEAEEEEEELRESGAVTDDDSPPPAAQHNNKNNHHHAAGARKFHIRPPSSPGGRPVGILKNQPPHHQHQQLHKANNNHHAPEQPATATSVIEEPKKSPPRLQPSSKDSRKKERAFAVRKNPIGPPDVSALDLPSSSPSQQHHHELPGSPNTARTAGQASNGSRSTTTTTVVGTSPQPPPQPPQYSSSSKPPVHVGMSIQERVKLLQETAGVVDGTAISPGSSVSSHHHSHHYAQQQQPPQQQQQHHSAAPLSPVAPSAAAGGRTATSRSVSVPSLKPAAWKAAAAPTTVVYHREDAVPKSTAATSSTASGASSIGTTTPDGLSDTDNLVVVVPRGSSSHDISPRPQRSLLLESSSIGKSTSSSTVAINSVATTPTPLLPQATTLVTTSDRTEDYGDDDDDDADATSAADNDNNDKGGPSLVSAPQTPQSSHQSSQPVTPHRPNPQTPPSSNNTPVKTNRQQVITATTTKKTLLDDPRDRSHQDDNNHHYLLQSLQRPHPPYELTRAFERPIPENETWIVQVGDAEWDGDNQKWRYRILVQRRNAAATSFTRAFCWRSVTDFFWLERSLTKEYHGALLIPVLSIALSRSEKVAAEMPVEADLLKDWLSDIMNGCRGHGEWSVRTPSDLIESESMESFLYKYTLQSPVVAAAAASPPLNFRRQASELRDIPVFAQCSDHHPAAADDGAAASPCAQKSFVDSLHAILAFDFCAGHIPDSSSTDPPVHNNRDGLERRQSRRNTPKVPGIQCESLALGSATDFSVQDSMVETSSTVSAMSLRPANVVGHSQLLSAERDLAASYRFTSMTTLERLQNLLHHEERVALGWKSFAEALANLFNYENKVELAEIRVKHMPYRTLTPDALKESLDEFVQRKTERSVPSLRHLQDMLSACIADLSAVEPSMMAYDGAVEQIQSFPDAESIAASEDSDGRRNLMTGIERAPSLNFPGRFSKASTAIIPRDEALYQRLLVNEGILRQSLTTLFHTSPLRRSRMAWAYFKSEIRQCADLQTASAALRKELGVVSSSSVSKLLKRHAKEEKEDHSNELALIQRMVHLGHAQRFAYDSGTDSAASATSIHNELVEVDNDDLSEERSKAIKRDRALEIARQRIGHWDAALAMAVMEAVGVEDPNVRVDETTKDLRAVRKYAIGLREMLNKCVEALGHLRESVENNPLKTSRQLFVHELSVLLSGIFVEGENLPRRSSASKSVLYHAGIDTSDAMGWLPSKKATMGLSQGASPNQLGDWIAQYLQTRDAPLEWLLSSLSDLLHDYFQRVEIVEGYVYMECVGIQLEKSFNSKRTKALAAFEKKADLTSAITVATKKRLPKVVKELAEKLKTIDISHTKVKETKDAHLESKAVKSDLHTLAFRRLVRARELSTERATSIIDVWAKEEELNATAEIKVLGNTIAAIERIVCDRMLVNQNR